MEKNELLIRRILLHAVFVLVVVINQPVFHALYYKNYHFQWSVEYQPLIILLYLLVLADSYWIAFGVLRLKNFWLRVGGVIVMFFLFIPLRYFVEQILANWLFGITNYPKDVSWAFFFHDNLVYAFIVILLGVFLKLMDDWLINDRVKATLEKQNLRLELDFLKSQVNPHFLFNTLNNIQSFIVQDEKMRSIELIGRLSEFMRFALYECDAEFISLDKEINMLTDYVELEKVRCDDRVKITFKTSGNFANYNIPPLLLMPFVENAFKHGADGQIANSWIDILIEQEQGQLHLKVTNSFSPQDTIQKTGGIGLQNVNKRLNYYFKGKHKLTINAAENIYNANLSLTL